MVGLNGEIIVSIRYNEYIYEEKYQAIGKFIDIKGSVADIIYRDSSMKNLFEQWNINNNELTFTKNKHNNVSLVGKVTCKSIAFKAVQPATEDFFIDQSKKFTNKVKEASNKIFEDKFILRKGMRKISFIPIDSEFTNLHNDFKNKFFRKEMPFFTCVDSQITLDISLEGKDIRVVIGVLKPNQAQLFFSNGLIDESDMKKSGYYIDIDINLGEKEKLNNKTKYKNIFSSITDNVLGDIK